MPERTRDRRRSYTPVPVGQDKRSGIDRREHTRVLVDIEVDYRADDTFLFAYITDISAMGIFVQTNNPEPAGTRLNLCFRLPEQLGGERIELEGQVIWINPHRPMDPEGRNPGMGIRFVDLRDSQRELLLQMVHTFAYLNDDDSSEDGPESGPTGTA